MERINGIPMEIFCLYPTLPKHSCIIALPSFLPLTYPTLPYPTQPYLILLPIPYPFFTLPYHSCFIALPYPYSNHTLTYPTLSCPPLTPYPTLLVPTPILPYIPYPYSYLILPYFYRMIHTPTHTLPYSTLTLNIEIEGTLA